MLRKLIDSFGEIIGWWYMFDWMKWVFLGFVDLYDKLSIFGIYLVLFYKEYVWFIKIYMMVMK